MNNVVLIGRLVRDPELRFLTTNSMAVCSFTLAVNKNLSKDKKAEFEQQGKPTADFIKVVVWGKLAENCSKYLEKGQKTAVSGSITTSSYTTDSGEKRYSIDVTASSVEFLERADKSSTQSNYNHGSEDFSDDDFQVIENNGTIPF